MNKNFIVSFIATGFIIGLLIVWQFKTPVPIAGNYPEDELQAKDTLLESFLNEQSYLQGRIVALRKQIEDSQKSVENQVEKANFDLLDNLKKTIGLTEVTGNGLLIFLNDNPKTSRLSAEVNDNNLIQASDIRDVVNILNAANALAIAVNNQRVIASSPIISVGTSILINNSYVAPPFTVSAVGDTEMMAQKLLSKGLISNLLERAKSGNITFEAKKQNNITIPLYNGDLRTKHINLIKND